MHFKVRMAAMMSRAFDFSPLAMVEVGDACSEWEAGSSGEPRASAGADVVVTGGCGVLSDAGGSAGL
jgi:hypothetical protein